MARIFDAVPAEIVGGVAKARGMRGLPAEIKAALKHLLASPILPRLLTNALWSPVAIFGVGGDGTRSLTEALAGGYYAVDYVKSADRKTDRSRIVLRHKLTGEEAVYVLPGKAAVARHRLPWHTTAVVIELPPPNTNETPA